MPPSSRKRPPGTRPWSQPLADLVGRAIDPVLARQGFGESDLILHWDDIVGERLAAVSQPIKLVWPPRPLAHRADAPPQPATLQIRVEGAHALELQHMSDQLLARINAHLGWRCVGKLAFRQGPIERTAPRAGRGRAPSPEALASASADVGALTHEPLRLALVRLGAHALRRDQENSKRS